MTRLWDRLLSRYGSTFWEGEASGAAVLTTTYGSPDREQVLPQLTAWAQQAYASSSPVFAAIAVRAMVFSEAVFTLQAKDDKHLFGNQSLGILEDPWPDGSSGELLARMEIDGSLAGNAYLWKPPGEDRLVRLRPDWVTVVSRLVHPPGGGQYREKAGYWWEPPKSIMDQGEGEFYPAEEVCHWTPGQIAPGQDFVGMSWLTAVYREVAADDGLTRHKIRYLQNAASPNMLLRYTQKLSPGSVDRLRERVEARYGGADNAYKTLILDHGADATVIGNSLSQMDFSNVEGAGEQRILAASGVPGVLVGLEPLRGAGRGYQESIAKFANMTMRPLWRSACKVLEKFVDDPSVQAGGSRLWFDTADIAMLQDGEMEKGQTALVRAQALLTLAEAGYTRESSIAAVDSGNLNLLQAVPGAPIPGTRPSAGNVQHLLGQPGQPGATAEPLPAGTKPRLPLGPVSPGGGGQNTRPIAQPASSRRALTNGHSND